MLSYRHGFHAGNFADVHKHVALTLLVQSLLRKQTPFCYLETHAGAALYDLDSEFAQKRREYENGIGMLRERDDCHPAVAAYLEAVRAANAPDGELRRYPGSPWIVHRMLRDDDRMVLAELHTTEVPLLRQVFAGDRRVAVHHQDGYQALKAFLPPRERRGLVLIDPAYERADEYERALAGLKTAQGRWQTGIVALWYPLQTRGRVDRLLRALQSSGIRSILLAELHIRPLDRPDQLNGSGLVIVNPPWQLDEQLRDVQAWLVDALAAAGRGRSRVDWLVPE
jgi:23S rRNA (adenine2030-N6)-methyltransferase